MFDHFSSLYTKGLITIAFYIHLKPAFNVPNEFLIMVRALHNFQLTNFLQDFLPPPEMEQGLPNKKTGIGSMPFHTTFPHDGIVQFRSILLTE